MQLHSGIKPYKGYYDYEVNTVKRNTYFKIYELILYDLKYFLSNFINVCILLF